MEVSTLDNMCATHKKNTYQSCCIQVAVEMKLTTGEDIEKPYRHP